MKKTLVVNKKDIDSGQFPIKSLEAYSLYREVKILVPDHAVIENGKINYMENKNGKSATRIQE